MNQEQATKIVGVIRAAYPDAKWEKKTQEVYEMFLMDLPYGDVHDVVADHIGSSKWMPKISEIRQEVLKKELGHEPAEAVLERIVENDSAKDESDLARRALKACGGLWEMGRTTAPGLWRKQFVSTYARLAEIELRTTNRESLVEKPQLRAANGPKSLADALPRLPSSAPHAGD